MESALGGEPRAVEDLAQRMRCIPRIVSALNRRSGRRLSEFELDDLAQDTVAAVLRRLPSYEGRASLETWFYRFCVFELLNARRGASRRAQTMSNLSEEHDVALPPIDPEERESDRGIEQLLRHLSDRESEVIRLRHIEQLDTLADVAERMDISLSSVKTHYYRALEKLRSVLEARHRSGREGLE